MKKRLIFITLIFSLFLWKGAIAQCQPPEFYMADPSNGLDCMGGMEQYLARSVCMSGMANKSRWGIDQPYLAALTKLNAQYIGGVGGQWSWQSDLIPNPYNPAGTTYYDGLRRAVTNINNAYAAANLRLPIIEAGIMEVVSNKPAQGIQLVPIPQYVRDAFSTDPDYVAEGFTGSFPTMFDFEQIVMNPGTGKDEDYMDINRVESRMWFYYAATTFIDLGYKAIHCGDIFRYTTHDPGFVKTAALFNMVRSYAKSKRQLILLNADTDHDLYLNNDNYTLILDFNHNPIRMDDSWDRDSYTGMPCDPASNPNGFNINSELNFYQWSEQLVNSHGGLSPRGCVYDQTPTQFAFDIGMDPYHVLSPLPQKCFNGYQHWGYDEITWFSLLDARCQDFWLRSAATAIRTDAFYRGYIMLPGVLQISCDAQGHGFGAQPELDITTPSWADLFNTISDILKMNDWNNFTVTEKCETSCNSSSCTTPVYAAAGRSGYRKYTLRATNPDASSVYTWHVQQVSSGKWLPVTFGPERVLEGLPEGFYKIGLRQDNAAFPCPKDAQLLEKTWKISSGSCCSQVSNRNIFPQGKMNSPRPGGLFNNNAAGETGPVQVYPNPTSKEINISINALTTNAIVVIKLIDIGGKVVATFNEKRTYNRGTVLITKSIAGIVPGNYVVQVSVNGTVYNQLLTIK